MVPSGGNVIYDRWIWLSCGFLVFVFFGFGKDAINIYRTGLLAIGMGRIFPILRQDYRGSITATISSYGSKARMIFKSRRSTSNSIWASTSKESYTTSSSDPVSPKKEPYLSTINESSTAPQTRSTPAHTSDGSKPSISIHILSALQPMKSTRSKDAERVPLASLGSQQATVQSVVTSSPRSPTLTNHPKSISSDEMLMRTEVRQGSEHGWPQVANTTGP